MALLLPAWNPVPALAQSAAARSGVPPAADPSTIEAELETVEVIGRREALRKEVQAFVADVTESDGELVARWNRPACLWVSGIPADQVALMRSRIAAVAASTGVPFSDTDGCRANLYVFVTREADQLLALLRKRNPRLFSGGSTLAMTSLLTSERPVRVWYDSQLLNVDGTPPIEAANKAPQFRLENSVIVGGVAENMSSVVIVVDAAKTASASLGQLTDYVSMVGFAQVEPGKNIDGRRTILSLFDTSIPGSAPSGLTDRDLAFLRGLYETDQADKGHRRLIVISMTRNLARQASR